MAAVVAVAVATGVCGEQLHPCTFLRCLNGRRHDDSPRSEDAKTLRHRSQRAVGESIASQCRETRANKSPLQTKNHSIILSHRRQSGSRPSSKIRRFHRCHGSILAPWSRYYVVLAKGFMTKGETGGYPSGGSKEKVQILAGVAVRANDNNDNAKNLICPSHDMLHTIICRPL
jgi:hypothetical protein